MLVNIGICLDKIDKSKIIKHTNGKKYLNLSLSDLKYPDKFGNDFIIYQYDKETKEKNIIGNGRTLEFKPQAKPEVADDNDIPF